MIMLACKIFFFFFFFLTLIASDTPEHSLSCACALTVESLNIYSHGGLVGLVVTASASRAEGPGFESRLRQDFSGVESYQ